MLFQMLFATGFTVLLTGLVGCSPSRYRQRADAEVYSLVEETASDPRWRLTDYTIEPSDRSRFYDPYAPDSEPMPPDDPTAHDYMHCVDCKKGWPCWHARGDTPFVENPDWRAYLPLDEQGDLVLDLRGAVSVSLVNSREYQREFENLYLSALDVSLERFRFDTQYFGGLSTFFESDGNGDAPATSELTVSPFAPANRLRLERLFTTGGELIVGIANSFVWQFSGPNSESAFTLVDLSFVQPLLRGAGRAVVMESLTEAQRELLYQVRDLERFRREFYAQIVTGRNSRSGGYYGLLENLQQIRNQRANVASLRESLAQLEALFEAGRENVLQVDQTRSQLLQSESGLLSQLDSYENSKDQFKLELGLPPDLPVRIEDPLLKQFDLIDPRMRQARDRVESLLAKVREDGQTISPEQFTQAKQAAGALRAGHEALFELINRDYQRLLANLPARREALQRLSARKEVTQGSLSERPVSVAELDSRAAKITEDLKVMTPRVEATWRELDKIKRRDPATFVGPAESERQPLEDWLTRLSGDLLELSLLQARIRLDSVLLRPIQIGEEDAMRIARENRRDLMNAQGRLVDAWRQIEIAANDLEAGLDVTFDGDISTTDDNPVRFRDKTGRLRVGFEFDAPLTRLAEQNAYRAELIDYQRARRDYMAYVDEIDRSLRDTLRTLRLNELNFELARSAVIVSVSQVEFTQLQLAKPVEVGAEGGRRGGGNRTTARDLVDALNDLLDAQNSFLAAWVDFQVQRVTLDLDLGTMQLDGNGMWIDPGDDLGHPGRVAADGAESDPLRQPAEPLETPRPDGANEPNRLLPMNGKAALNGMAAPKEMPTPDSMGFVRPLPLPEGMEPGAVGSSSGSAYCFAPHSGERNTGQSIVAAPYLENSPPGLAGGWVSPASAQGPVAELCEEGRILRASGQAGESARFERLPAIPPEKSPNR